MSGEERLERHWQASLMFIFQKCSTFVGPPLVHEGSAPRPPSGCLQLWIIMAICFLYMPPYDSLIYN